jgi:hypothetical protein
MADDLTAGWHALRERARSCRHAMTVLQCQGNQESGAGERKLTGEKDTNETEGDEQTTKRFSYCLSFGADGTWCCLVLPCTG